jgi:hypothetical protein
MRRILSQAYSDKATFTNAIVAILRNARATLGILNLQHRRPHVLEISSWIARLFLSVVFSDCRATSGEKMDGRAPAEDFISVMRYAAIVCRRLWNYWEQLVEQGAEGCASETRNIDSLIIATV